MADDWPCEDAACVARWREDRTLRHCDVLECHGLTQASAATPSGLGACLGCARAYCAAHAEGGRCADCHNSYCAACRAQSGTVRADDWWCPNCQPPCDRPECVAHIAAWEAAHRIAPRASRPTTARRPTATT